MRRNILLSSLAPALVACTSPFVYAETYLTEDQVKDVLFPGETFADASVALTPEQQKEIELASDVHVRSPRMKQIQEKVRALKASGGGWLIFSSTIGQHEFIDYALALNADGSVKGVEILTYRERYGGEVRDPKWRAQFTSKTVQDPVKLNDDIRNISGATLSSNNITKGVRRLLHTWNLVLRNS